MHTIFSQHKGFTLLGLMIVLAIFGVVSSISISSYNGYIETSKNAQAVMQIRTLSALIDDYALENGEYPRSLRDINNENLLDPWGNNYHYLNLSDNYRDEGSSNSGSGYSYEGGGSEEQNSDSEQHGNRNENSERDDDEYGNRNENSERDDDDDEHGNRNENSERDDDDEEQGNRNENSERDDDDEYNYVSEEQDNSSDDSNAQSVRSSRKDANQIPINTNFDLCSFGKNGKTKLSLGAEDSRDDIIYANNGSYIGLAEEF